MTWRTGNFIMVLVKIQFIGFDCQAYVYLFHEMPFISALFPQHEPTPNVLDFAAFRANSLVFCKPILVPRVTLVTIVIVTGMNCESEEKNSVTSFLQVF